METHPFTIRQIALAVFISLMSISSIIAVFTTNILLKRKQYGILIANGFTQKDIVVCLSLIHIYLAFFFRKLNLHSYTSSTKTLISLDMGGLGILPLLP